MILNCRWSIYASGRISRLHRMYVSAFLFPNIPFTVLARWYIKCRPTALFYILIWLCFKNSYKTHHRREGKSTLSVKFTYWRYDSNVLVSIK